MVGSRVGGTSLRRELKESPNRVLLTFQERRMGERQELIAAARASSFL
jgi:hypothetical protein